MTLLSVVAGLLVAPAVAAVVYLDGRRRGRAARPRAAWAVGSGLTTLGGFVLPAASDGAVFRAYEGVVRPEPPVVTVSPFELVALRLAVGGAVAVGVLVAYGVATRAGG